MEERRPSAADVLRRQMAKLAPTAPGLRLVVLFGSVARGQALADSDVDIGLLGAGFWEGLRTGSELAATLAREPDVVDLDAASELLRFQVAREGVLLYEHEPFAWARFQAQAALRYFDLAPMIQLCAEGARRRLAREAQHG
jgi:uncharacterized protein